MLNELKAYKKLDVYVTGSNSKALSSDIATEFIGRAKQIHVFPLSFEEFYSYVGGDENKALDKYMQEHWKSIKQQIRERKYKPQPVLRVEIPKPNGGVRKLGIPTVIDRVIEQAIAQVLTPIFEPEFSENSYGFRPNRRCEQAIIKLLEYFNDGYVWIVDIDLEKFFDNVPQDKLISYVGRIIHDGDTEV